VQVTEAGEREKAGASTRENERDRNGRGDSERNDEGT